MKRRRGRSLRRPQRSLATLRVVLRSHPRPRLQRRHSPPCPAPPLRGKPPALAGTLTRVLGVWIVLWIVVLLGLAAPFLASFARRWPPVAAPLLALLGVLALRALVIFSAQT